MYVAFQAKQDNSSYQFIAVFPDLIVGHSRSHGDTIPSGTYALLLIIR